MNNNLKSIFRNELTNQLDEVSNDIVEENESTNILGSKYIMQLRKLLQIALKSKRFSSQRNVEKQFERGNKQECCG